MEKRVLLAVFLSFLVLFIYQGLVGPSPERNQTIEPLSSADDQGAQQPIGRAATTPATAPVPIQEVAQLSAAETLVADETARDVIVETDFVRAVFSNEGAVLTSWRLKGYRDGQKEPLELIPQELEGVRPFSLLFETRPELTATLQKALFRPSRSELLVTDRIASLEFEYRDTSGLRAFKAFRFDPDQPFVVHLEVEVETLEGPEDVILQWGPGLAGGDAGESSTFRRQGPQGIFSQAGEVSRLDASDLLEQADYDGRFDFVGIDDHYFISAAIPNDEPLEVHYEPFDTTATSARNLVAYDIQLPTTASAATFFVGPKDFDVLGNVNSEFVRAVHFGIFSWLVVPLHRSLKWVYGFVGNYGWSIILITIMINALMFPLRHKSVVSMRKMQEIQPEMKAIQDRYKNLKATDPGKQKMNQELMSLYRERGVNPASGCLPMLLTMPVLFAFYSLLSVAIEIRDAPFILWIQDLSQHDPLYVTPILMGVTMVAQQKMTPSTADPMQQKIMMVMPVVFTFMFLWAPSGLVLYWLMSNVWGVGQQIITNRVIGPPPVHNVRPPAERLIKKRGAGKKGKGSRSGNSS